MKKTNSITKTMLSVSSIVILAKALGLIKQMVTANAFGATIETDIISLSEGLVANTDYLLVQALSTAFIPTYISIKTERGKETSKFVSNTIKVFLTITIVLSCLFFLLSPVIARILAPSYSLELSASLAKYIRIFAPVLIIIIELAVFNALLKANESFIPGELISFNQSAILIVLVIILGGRIGPDTLVVAFYAYAVFNLTYLMVHSKMYWSIERGNPFTDKNVQQMLKMMGPLLLGYSMIFVNQQVDKVIVSGLGEGTVTAMNYAAVLSNFVSTFIGSICGVLFTYITKNIAEKKNDEAAILTVKSAVQISTLLIPISVIVIMNSRDIVMIVFGRGKFDSLAVRNCSMALIGYGVTFVPFVFRELFSRFQYAYGDSKKPMINSTIAILFNIALSVIMSRVIGILGVTLATSISVLICALLNVISSRKRNSGISLKEYLKYVPRWGIGIGVCIGMSMIGQHILIVFHPIVRFVMITLFSFGIYALINLPILMPLIRRYFHK